MKKPRKHPLINWISSFVEAWEMLLDIPLPPNLSKQADEDSPDPAKVLCCFPVVGLFAGIAFFLAAWLFRMLAGRPAAAVLGALLVAIVYEFATKGRMISSVASLIENLFAEENRSDAFLNIDDSVRKSHDTFGSVGMLAFFALRVLTMVFIIFTGHISWLIITMAAGFTVQAHLARLPDLESGEPFIEVASGRGSHLPWVAFAAIAVVFGITVLPAAVITVMIVALVAFLASKYIPDTVGGVNGPMIGLSGYCTETLVLFLGIVLCRT